MLFDRGGLFFINGRGSAHDADVLMEPPIQMPFIYPIRIIYECKAYTSRVALTVVRNALGLRYDINEFEVVTYDSLLERQNNRRSDYAVEKRNRYYYQVGVASMGGFTKPAVEFSTNNKIPLLSMKEFIGQSVTDTYDEINQAYVESIEPTLISEIYMYFKDRSPEADKKYSQVQQFLGTDNKIRQVMSAFSDVQGDLYVGIIESGDIIFLRAKNERSRYIFQGFRAITGLTAQIHYSRRKPEIWELSLSTERYDREPAIFSFFVPPPIMARWREFDLANAEAIRIKGELFSRLFIFNRGNRPELPFFIVNIDRAWLHEVQQSNSDWDRSD